MEDKHKDCEPGNDHSSKRGISRRNFLWNVTLAGAGYTILPLIGGDAKAGTIEEESGPQVADADKVGVDMTINGQRKSLLVDPRTTLLDLLRENLAMPGTKKGCDHGQCGACTVLINDRRINSCLKLAASCRGAVITTIEGLASGDNLHPMQEAFIKHDAFQCGYCTPGQICSAVGLKHEVTPNSNTDINELMSGNICRCGAYQNINDAIREVYSI